MTDILSVQPWGVGKIEIFAVYLFALSGGAGDKGQDDGVRDNHGRLPTAGGQGQLLPHGDLKSRSYLRRHRLSYRGD